ncbi:MAG: VanZ family protein [Kiritimatiellales bacterium]|nr:VanZ family protein [Kiritimatiellales bacterium]
MVFRLAAVVYLLMLGYFAFKPFRLVPHCFDTGGTVMWNADRTAVRIAPGGALEDKRDSARLRNALVASGKMSLEVVLRTGSLNQSGPARIVSYSRDPMSRNFTLAQEGNGLAFRLRTTSTDLNGMLPCLVVPGVFDTSRRQHLVVTYDGTTVRLYVDGVASPGAEALTGGFENWGRDHALTVGDEATGERLWLGEIYRIVLYDRALATDEVKRLYHGETMEPNPAAVVEYAFNGDVPAGMKPLRYRNLFVVSDLSIFDRSDCLANIFGFIPLAPLLFFALPVAVRPRKFVAVVVASVLLGGAISGLFEVVQRYIVGRVPSVLDIACNVLGSLLGALILWSVGSKVRNRGRLNV